MQYAITKNVTGTFDETVDQVVETFQSHGFGTLAMVSLSEKIKNKLDKDIGNYELLMVCNPTFAYEFIHDDKDLGVFLPCTVVVYETKEQVTVSVLQPQVLTENILDDETKHKLSQKITVLLQGAMDALV